LRVLAPVVHALPGGPAVRSLGSDSQNTNGHSITLLLRHGRATFLLTGDLNKSAQQALLQEYAGREAAFACDVAKACHHGSEDVSWRFLECVRAAATIISSGDNEGHAHPRPAIVAASALTGFTTIDPAADQLLTPLVYSTEIERSVAHGLLSRIDTARYPHLGGAIDLRIYGRPPAKLDVAYRTDALAKRYASSRVYYTVTTAGALHPTPKNRSLHGCYVVSGVIYGLVNVRTVGTTIMCASRNESKNSWNVKAFPSRVLAA
jgi:hypothetical protein